MFDEPTSMPMCAAIASLLGGCFGVALILFTHSASAQARPPADEGTPTVAETTEIGLWWLGDALLQGLRRTEPASSAGSAGIRGLRINGASSEAGGGLRWQVAGSYGNVRAAHHGVRPWGGPAGSQGQRSEGEIALGRDLVGVGVQVRF